MKTPARTKSFHLPMLAALPALLASCGADDDLGRYSRVQYATYQDCLLEHQPLVEQGVENPCTEENTGEDDVDGRKKTYYGPYMYLAGGLTRYVGYQSRYTGQPLGTGLTYDAKKGTYGSFKAPVSRGGLTTSARAGGSSGSAGRASVSAGG